MTLVTPLTCTVALTRQATEGSLLAATRTVYGDASVARALFACPYDAGFTSRHTNQLAALWTAHLDAVGGLGP